MEMSDMAESRGKDVTVTEPISVEVASVEGELANIWLKATEGGIPGITAPMTRVLLSNLLVYAATDADANKAKAVVSEIAANHPARVVIADAQQGEQGKELKADVSMICNITDRGKTLCGEEIRIHPHGLAQSALGTILPILAPDLPIYLWAPGELIPNDEVLPELAHIADHWVVDSREFYDWPASLGQVISVGLHREPPVILHDLCWGALSQGREIVAQFFDPLPAREYLRGISEVEIRHKPSVSGIPPAEPVFMVAWMITQLKWQTQQVLKEGDAWIIKAQSQKPVTVRIQPISQSARPIESITINSEVDGKQGRFSISPTDSTNEFSVESKITEMPEIGRTVKINEISVSSLLLQALDTLGKDVLYYKTLPAIEDLMKRIEATDENPRAWA